MTSSVDVMDGSSSFIFVDSVPYLSYKFVGAKFLESGNLLSDSYMFIRTLTRLTIYMYYNRLSFY